MITEEKRGVGHPRKPDDLRRKDRKIRMIDQLWTFCSHQAEEQEISTSRYIERLIQKAEIESRIL